MKSSKSTYEQLKEVNQQSSTKSTYEQLKEVNQQIVNLTKIARKLCHELTTNQEIRINSVEKLIDDLTQSPKPTKSPKPTRAFFNVTVNKGFGSKPYQKPKMIINKN